MNEDDADESSQHELHHGENSHTHNRVRKFRKRVKKPDGKKVADEQQGSHDASPVGDNTLNQGSRADNKASTSTKKHHIPRHLRGKHRKKKLSGFRTAGDGYENSGYEQSDFLFTDGDQSVSEEDDGDVKDVVANFDNNPDNGPMEEHHEHKDVDNKDVCNTMANLAVSTINKESCDSDKEKVEDNTDNAPLQDKQQPKQQSPARKRSRKKKNRNTPGKQTQPSIAVCYEADHDPNEDEDDYPSNITENLTSPAKTEENTEDMTTLEQKNQQPKRTLEEELAFLTRISPTKYMVEPGFVPNMKVPAEIIVNDDLQTLLVQELHDTCCGPKSNAGSSFIPALKQAANVAALPGIVKASLAMPDIHSGYGFCIGNVAAFDMDDPNAVISPGGVGFDINCGVRLIRTNLTEKDVDGKVREELADAMFRNIPVGVGVDGGIPCTSHDLDMLLKTGIDWAIEKGYAWEEDKAHCEEFGRMETADPKCVSKRAKKRGLKQLGTLGAGNHYAEIQVVDEIYDSEAAKTMGICTLGQVCIMIHTGSRGLGHQVATDALTEMEKAMARDQIELNDRQLSCARISSREGQEYLAAMSAAANFAWVNRSCITYLARKAFSDVFQREPDDLDMSLVYDVCHNIAKVEQHVVDGEEKTLLVHRKGSTRAFPPQHPNLPKDYKSIGQPVLIGGTMGTCSYVLVGTDKGMSETFGSTCHGAGRALSRNQSRKKLDHKQVLDKLKENGIAIRVASPKLVTEEAPESYKDVCEVIETCQDAGISQKVVKLRPIAVIKG